MTALAKKCPQCGIRYEARAGYCQRDGTALVLVEAQVDPWLGKTLMEQFRIEERIGRGGMGSVYRAHQVVLGRDVAVKILHSELSQSVEAKQRFLREARILTAIDHPNVVRVFLFGELPDGSLFIVMELLRGKVLSDILKQETCLATGRAAHIAHQVALGVGEAHAQGVVHRDLKPENILIVPKKRDPDHAKVLDFGIARVFDGDPGDNLHTRTGLIFGTARYISPEGARGDRTDARSDVYSMGVVLYEMLSGHIPFSGDTQVDILQAHVSTVPRPLNDWPAAEQVPQPLVQLVMRCLAKAPERRPSDAHELADLLAPFVERSRARDHSNEASGIQPIGVRSADRQTADSIPPQSFTTPFYARPWFWLLIGLLVCGAALGAWLKANPSTTSDETEIALLNVAVEHDDLGPEAGEVERLSALRLANRPDDNAAMNARTRVAGALIERAQTLVHSDSGLAIRLLDRATALSPNVDTQTVRNAIAEATREEISVIPTAIAQTAITLRARAANAVGLSEPHFDIYKNNQRVQLNIAAVVHGAVFEAAYLFQSGGTYEIRFVAGTGAAQIQLVRQIAVERGERESPRARPEEPVTTILSASPSRATPSVSPARAANQPASAVVAVPVAQPEIQPLRPTPPANNNRGTDDEPIEAPPPWQSTGQ